MADRDKATTAASALMVRIIFFELQTSFLRFGVESGRGFRRATSSMGPPDFCPDTFRALTPSPRTKATATRGGF
jgi:hypothetical protein